MDAMEWADEKIGKLNTTDVALIKISAMTAGLLLARWIPGLRKVPSGLLVAVMLGLAVKPLTDAYSQD